MYGDFVSGKAHVYLDGLVNRQNCRLWGLSSSDWWELNKFMSFTVWCGFRVGGITGPFLFENAGSKTLTVNGARYREMTIWSFVPKLQEKVWTSCDSNKLRYINRPRNHWISPWVIFWSCILCFGCIDHAISRRWIFLFGFFWSLRFTTTSSRQPMPGRLKMTAVSVKFNYNGARRSWKNFDKRISLCQQTCGGRLPDTVFPM